MDVRQTIEIDPDFEPQTRVRCNTWPCRPREDVVEAQCSPVSDESVPENHVKQDNLGLNKKTSSRRNAWGNLSYADLITKAIQSSPEQRLTLSQIYDWMVQNVPYFKDKGDSTSSAGWKNSIRHNLSLHSRFMRIQNEGTGKSSWWVINPDAKPGKTPRRRVSSMETKSYEKRRGRVKRKVEAIRQAMENNSPSSTTDDYLDSPLGFQLSPDFRPRSTSNASSCGRLSPIQAGIEPDLHDNQVPPMSPIPWGQEVDTCTYTDSLSQFDPLISTLVDGINLDGNMGIQDKMGPMRMDATNEMDMMSSEGGIVQQLLNRQNQAGNLNDGLNQQMMSTQYSDPSANFDDSGQYGGTLPAPPAYSETQIRRSPQQQQQQQQTLEQLLLQNGGYNDLAQLQQQQNMRMYNNSQSSQRSPIYSQQEALLMQQTNNSPSSSSLNINTQMPSPARSPQQQQISPSFGNCINYGQQKQHSPQAPSIKSLSPQQHQQLINRQQQSSQPPPLTQPSLLQRCLESSPTDSLLRAALTQKGGPQYTVQTSNSNQPPYNSTGYTNLRPVPRQNMNLSNGINNNLITSQQNARNMMSSLQTVSSQNQMTSSQLAPGQQQAQPMPDSHSANSLNEIDPDPFGCDIEKVLEQEWNLEGNLDFDFDPGSNSTTTDTQSMVR